MKMKKLALITLVLFIALVSNAWATILYEYTGSLTGGGGSLITNPNWQSGNGQTSLLWRVSYDDTTSLWTYNYTFNVAASPGISHVIIEVSNENISIASGSTPGLMDTYGTSPSNPGWPSNVSFPGIKWEDLEGEYRWNWNVVTDRNPMWGDFYAKGGANNNLGYAYNSMFGTDTFGPIGDGNNGGWALVPDTDVVGKVPEPTTLILYGLGFAGAGLYRRLRRSK
jgi:hypothetical protein